MNNIVKGQIKIKRRAPTTYFPLPEVVIFQQSYDRKDKKKKSEKKGRYYATHPLTLVSSTANVFIAPCIRSKLVLFQTKSTLNPWFASTGTP